MSCSLWLRRLMSCAVFFLLLGVLPMGHAQTRALKYPASIWRVRNLRHRKNLASSTRTTCIPPAPITAISLGLE